MTPPVEPVDIRRFQTTPQALPALSPAPSLADFGQGVRLPFQALSLVWRPGPLRSWSLVASVATLLLMSAVVVASTWWAPSLASWLYPRPDALPYRLLWYLLIGGIWLVLMAIGLPTLPLLALAPIQDSLSEATEQLLTGNSPTPFSMRAAVGSSFTALKHTVARVGVLLLGHLVLLPLNLIPVAGNLMWATVTILWSSLWLAGEYLGVPMSRHLLGFRQLRAMLRERFALCLGFGLSLYVLMWVPLVNLFLVPAATVAGTLLFHALRSAGSLQPAERLAPDTKMRGHS